jgi:hypothetical protein
MRAQAGKWRQLRTSHGEKASERKHVALAV